MGDKFLNGAYELDTPEQTKELYREWASTYDADLEEHGYASPRRTAEALRLVGAPLDKPLLDIGCGSGLSGVLLNTQGFTNLVGSDFSPEMLEQAEQKDIYKQLHLADFSAPFDYISEPYPVMAAVGVFSIGHAGPDVLAKVIELMPVGGFFGFSLNDHALADQGYLAQINRDVQNKSLRLRWQEYGDHVPGIGLQSMIIVIERL